MTPPQESQRIFGRAWPSSSTRNISAMSVNLPSDCTNVSEPQRTSANVSEQQRWRSLSALRTGHDPLDPKNGLLAVMPWPAFRHMTGRDLDAIYAYLTAIPSATPPPVGMHCKNPGQ